MTLERVKQVILVPRWLGMQPGKIASQCCWAAVLFGVRASKRIILRVDTPEQLEDLIYAAKSVDLTVEQVVDEGLTEVPPNSITAISIVGEESVVDTVTGGLPLL